MERIASFSVDHRVLEPGVYVSRRDVDEKTGAVVTTFDLRLTTPNREPVMDTAAVHALEHLGATFLRNDPAWSSRIIYFGPMGCRTGFYMSLIGTPSPETVAKAWENAMLDALNKVPDESKIPELNEFQCGSYKEHSLAEAHDIARNVLKQPIGINRNEDLALDEKWLNP